MYPELSPERGQPSIAVHRFGPDILTSRMFPLVRRCPRNVPQCPPCRAGTRTRDALKGSVPQETTRYRTPVPVAHDKSLAALFA